MIKNFINKKVGKYIYCDNMDNDRFETINRILPKDICNLIHSFYSHMDFDQSLLDAIRNRESYEVMNEILKYGVDLQNVYNRFKQNIIDYPEGWYHFRPHPDLITFLIDNNIEICDEIYSKISTIINSTCKSDKKAILNALEYKTLNLQREIRRALQGGDIIFANKLINCDINLLYDYKIYNDLFYGATVPFFDTFLSYKGHFYYDKFITLLFFLKLPVQHKIDPVILIEVGHKRDYCIFYIILNLYLEKGGKRFIINKEISDYILRGISGTIIIEFFHKYGFIVEEYENILNNIPSIFDKDVINAEKTYKEFIENLNK